MADFTTRTKRSYAIAVTKADGTDGTVENLTAASSDETVIRVVPDDDTGLTGFVEGVAPSQVDAAGAPIANRVTWDGDSDLGAGVNHLILVSEDCFTTLDSRDVPQATAMKVTFGAAEDKAAAP
jgi:hypothetical protein